MQAFSASPAYFAGRLQSHNRIKETTMKSKLTQITMTLVALLALFVWLLTVSVQAQTDTSKPSPELKELEVFVGDWTYEGEQVYPPVAGLPYGPAGKFSGTITTRFILDGFFLESKIEDNNPSGRTNVIEITGYDAKAKSYVKSMFVNDGSREASVQTVSPYGRIWMSNSTLTTRKGDEVLVRSVLTFPSDRASYISTTELSVDDGKTWKHWFKEEGRKLKK